MNIFILNQIILLASQTPMEGFEEAAKESTISALLVSIVIALAGVVIFLFKKNDKLNKEMTKTQKENANKIDTIRKEHADKLEEIRKEMIEHEEERNRQWIESEKETLTVLKGVSSVLEMSEKMSKYDSENIIKRIEQAENKIQEIQQSSSQILQKINSLGQKKSE